MKRMSAAAAASVDQECNPVPARRKITARYPIATIGSRTVQGGEVVVADNVVHMDGFRIACVGDRVRYPDGSESIIVSGAGNASTFGDRPVALVGSHVENGDRIALSRQNMAKSCCSKGIRRSRGCCNPATCRHGAAAKPEGAAGRCR
ncbi:PAAR domain-containing protein [Massilia alkalitolerans]|uniref:PAAR domain-containing protein n=1 Tax=Massilia alkalitolerans TaxID=286638 RepID=UPI001E33EE33|nr:PAAR domain-containing protein [Massilia alkalitolerans]